jgi:succinate-acetate transporter protein
LQPVFGFSTTTLLLSLFNIQVAGIEVPNAVLGYAISYGGLAQFLAGLWEFASGNTFGATVFCSFGMFWWGYSVILVSCTSAREVERETLHADSFVFCVTRFRSSVSWARTTVSPASTPRARPTPRRKLRL